MKVSNNFQLHEFVHPKLWKKYGRGCTKFLDYRIILLAQEVRELFDQPIIINGRFRGNIYKNSGYRTPKTPVGAYYSQHKFGRAIDVKFANLRDYDEARKIIIANYARLKPFGLTAMEAGTPTWLHLDVRWSMSDDLIILPYK